MKGGGGVDQMAMANAKIEAMAQEISALRATIDRLTALVEEKPERCSDEERQKERQLQSLPVLKEYYAWLETIFMPAGKLKKAITYSLNQREYLCAFIDHGEIEISNNQVENVIGRKNRLFCDTQKGAEAGAILYTVPETAKANGLNPEAYPGHLLSVLPTRFAKASEPQIETLMPWAEVMQQLFCICKSVEY